MARNTTFSPNGKYEIAWGNDHACGWFIQIFDLEHEDQDHPEALVVNKDALFDGISARDVINIATEYGAGDTVHREIVGL